MMKMTLREVPTQDVRDATMAQRRRRGLSIVDCNQARVGGESLVGNCITTCQGLQPRYPAIRHG